MTLCYTWLTNLINICNRLIAVITLVENMCIVTSAFSSHAKIDLIIIQRETIKAGANRLYRAGYWFSIRSERNKVLNICQ